MGYSVFCVLGEILEDLERYNVEGDVIKTEGVSRGAESFHHTQFDGDGAVAGMSSEEIHAVRATVEQQLSSWHQVSVLFFPNFQLTIAFFLLLIINLNY